MAIILFPFHLLGNKNQIICQFLGIIIYTSVFEVFPPYVKSLIWIKQNQILLINFLHLTM